MFLSALVQLMWWGVVKSLGVFPCGPVGLIHTQEFRFEKNKTPTSVVESYKTTYGHKAVVLMSDVEGMRTWNADRRERPAANSKLLLERNLLEGRLVKTGAYRG